MNEREMKIAEAVRAECERLAHESADPVDAISELDAAAIVASVPGEQEPVDIEKAVSRFLGWKLPATFSPDGGASFKPPYPPDSPHRPTGTNLFNADEARQMLEYVLEGCTALPARPIAAPDGMRLVPAKEFNDLTLWLDRCHRKGHLDDLGAPDLLEPWEAFVAADQAASHTATQPPVEEAQAGGDAKDAARYRQLAQLVADGYWGVSRVDDVDKFGVTIAETWMDDKDHMDREIDASMRAEQEGE